MFESMYILAGVGLLGVLGLTTLIALFLRRVVSTNEVHVVQSAKKTTSYGKDTGFGNSYYAWPSWLPVIGITKSVFTTSVFDLDLNAYEAYDKGRLPFVVDVKAFFRITDTNMAAQRVSKFDELHSQLEAIVQGAVRVILASNDIEEILQGRSTFGEQFTKEVEAQLKEWGVSTVKNIELMDIRDSKDSHVIKNIMEKKKSHIEMESRTEVAKNKRIAEVAEIEAKREVDLQQQQAKQVVGLRTVDTQREVALSEQNALQTVKEQEKTTKEKEMAVLKVQELRKAEITREVEVTKAQQNKQTAVLTAEAQKETSVLTAEAKKQTTVLVAEGELESKRREAEAIHLTGTAKAEAEKALLLAPVDAQIKLAKEIGANKEYQEYLITIRRVEAEQAVGIEQAHALKEADIKVIANTGNVSSGVNSLSDLFTAKGGTQIAAALEAFTNSETGGKLVSKLTGGEKAS